MVLSSVVDEDTWSVGLGRPDLQVPIEERPQDVAAELERGVSVPLKGPRL